MADVIELDTISGRHPSINGSHNHWKEYWRLGKFYILFFITMFLSAILVVIICVFVTADKKNFLESKNDCSEGTFPCKQGGCVNRTLMCNKILDCIDGSDEGNWCDPFLDDYWDRYIRKRPDADREDESAECVLPYTPEGCICRKQTNLYCEEADLNEIPPDIPTQVTALDLSSNDLEMIQRKAFKNLTNLKEIHVTSSRVKVIEDETFRYNWRLKRVFLTKNELSSFPGNIFSKWNQVEELHLSDNEISSLKNSDLRNLHQLKTLFLNSNNIKHVEAEVFKWTKQLSFLDLSANKLLSIRKYYFNQTPSLTMLYLQENSIDYIEPGSFTNLSNLVQLSLSHNNLQYLSSGIFDGLSNLTTLVLTNNNILSIEETVFNTLFSIRSLNLKENPFATVPKETFSLLTTLQNVYFDKIHFCAYVSDVISCEPRGDGISSQENLLENIVLRISVWVVAILACAGNILVLLGRFLLKEDNQIHSFFIKNLSFADMIMGVYLLMIGTRDKMYRGNYVFHDEEWRNSWTCDLSGIISTVSSEVSVLTLTVITLDRYICIMYPLSLRKRGLKVAYCVMGFTWLMCILFAVIPVIGIPYFGTTFYRNNGVCIPLHLHDPRANGWEYSSFLFIGMNLASFLFISYAYLAMFVSIKHTEVPLRTTRESRERCLVKRFSFIVITDFICWIPIIIIKVVALSGVKISGDLYAWVVVFILPVNSALNPLLYTLTTKLFKQKLISKFATVVWRPNIYRDSSQSCPRHTLTRHHQNGIELDKMTKKNTSTCVLSKSSSYKLMNGSLDNRKNGGRNKS